MHIFFNNLNKQTLALKKKKASSVDSGLAGWLQRKILLDLSPALRPRAACGQIPGTTLLQIFPATS